MLITKFMILWIQILLYCFYKNFRTKITIYIYIFKKLKKIVVFNFEENRVNYEATIFI